MITEEIKTEVESLCRDLSSHGFQFSIFSWVDSEESMVAIGEHHVTPFLLPAFIHNIISLPSGFLKAVKMNDTVMTLGFLANIAKLNLSYKRIHLPHNFKSWTNEIEHEIFFHDRINSLSKKMSLQNINFSMAIVTAVKLEENDTIGIKAMVSLNLPAIETLNNNLDMNTALTLISELAHSALDGEQNSQNTSLLLKLTTSAMMSFFDAAFSDGPG